MWLVNEKREEPLLEIIIGRCVGSVCGIIAKKPPDNLAFHKHIFRIKIGTHTLRDEIGEELKLLVCFFRNLPVIIIDIIPCHRSADGLGYGIVTDQKKNKQDKRKSKDFFHAFWLCVK